MTAAAAATWPRPSAAPPHAGDPATLPTRHPVTDCHPRPAATAPAPAGHPAPAALPAGLPAPPAPPALLALLALLSLSPLLLCGLLAFLPLLALLHLLGKLLRFLLQPLLLARQAIQPALRLFGTDLRSLARQLLLLAREVVLPAGQLPNLVERRLTLGRFLARLDAVLLLVIGLLAHQLLIEERRQVLVATATAAAATLTGLLPRQLATTDLRLRLQQLVERLHLVGDRAARVELLELRHGSIHRFAGRLQRHGRRLGLRRLDASAPARRRRRRRGVGRLLLQLVAYFGLRPSHRPDVRTRTDRRPIAVRASTSPRRRPSGPQRDRPSRHRRRRHPSHCSAQR